ncbi:hypothetical protein K0A97_00755 [Patescibacteria group bacterium]|nr:hypothetical protein [Patescibacteria group bacterium]
MPQVKFKFDKRKDIWNHWDTSNYISPWTKKKANDFTEIDKICKNKGLEECKKDVEKFLKPIHDNKLLYSVIEAFQRSWDNINDEYFRILKKITGKPMPFDMITGYLTTQKRCPYDPKEPSFMVSIFSSIPNALKVCAHELMHIHFHNTDWPRLEKQVGKEKTSNLKEALTVLLNLEFKGLWILRDEGYDSDDQQKLRDFIEREWKKEKDFDSLLNKCVDYLKEDL